MSLIKTEGTIWKRLFNLPENSPVTLQAQLREVIVQAVLSRRLSPGTLLPPSRALAEELGISRNTVSIVYQSLVNDGFLTSHQRVGYMVNTTVPQTIEEICPAPIQSFGQPAQWLPRLASMPSTLPSVEKPLNWQDYPFPFVYGQFDATLFPVAEWRDVNRLAQRTMSVREWAGDRVDADDASLVEQIQQRLLSRRGIWAAPEQILVTVGAQHAAYLVSSLLMRRSHTVGVEEPGYPDIRNICSLFGARLMAIPLDKAGLQPLDELAGCDYLYVTPSHQNPTGVTMPLARRQELLESAAKHDFVIVEDDYDSELVYEGKVTPAIKSLDRDGRVLYIGSLSKTIAPGLRMGFMVGPAEFIAEARAMRRLMMRHPPTNNQRALALFLSLGYYDIQIRKLVQVYRARAQILVEALQQHLPSLSFVPPRGGSSLWLDAPPDIDMSRVALHAREHGLLLDAGKVFFGNMPAPQNFFRLGYSSMPTIRITEGIELLARIFSEFSHIPK